MTTALAIQKTIVPPPTKTEVVEALVQLRWQEWKKKNKELKEATDKLKEAIEKEAFSIAVKRSLEEAKFAFSTWNAGHVEVEFTVSPSDLKADFKKYKKLKDSFVCWDEKEERKKIVAALNGAKGKRDLLSNEDTRKKLVNLGAEIGVL